MKARRLLLGFWHDRRANIGMMTGLVAFPLIVASGLSVEYGAYVNTKILLDKAAASCTEAASANWQSMLRLNPGELEEAAKARGQAAFDADVPVSLAGTYVVEAVVAKNGDGLASGCTYKAQIPTVFAAMIGIESVGADGLAKSSTQLVSGSPVEPGYLLREKFDQAGAPPKNDFTYYWLSSYNGWSIKTQLEIGTAKAYNQTPPSGQYNIVELDAFNNSSMAKKVYLTAGTYELRYYLSDHRRIDAYAPVAICGSESAGVDWATDATQYVKYTSRIGVYLDKATGTVPPTDYSPTTNTLIDVCVQAGYRWIERSVKIRINTPADYWLAFQGEGVSDGYGGFLSDIRLCVVSCPGTPMKNFPWAAGTVLYKDGFEVPRIFGAGKYDTSLDASGLRPGWTKAPTSWATWPYNQVDFHQFAGQDNSYALELDGTGTQSNLNRGISRKLLLAPGFYELSYYYKTASPIATVGLCGLSSVNNDVATLESVKTSNDSPDTAIVKVYLDSDLLVSHPEVPGALNATPTWKDPNGAPATLPRLPVTSVDACTHSNSWVLRTVNFKISRVAYYWLTIRAEGASEGHGGIIDNVTLQALGDLADPAPAPLVTIPSAGKPVGSTINLGSVEIVAQ